MSKNVVRDALLLGVNVFGVAAWGCLAATAVRMGLLGLAAMFVGVCSLCGLAAIGAALRLAE